MAITAPVAAPKKKMAVWLKILIAIALFILVVIGLAFWATSGVTKAVNTHVDLLRQGKIEQAYNDTTTAGFRQATPLAAFEAYVAQNTILTQNKKLVMTESEFKNDAGRYVGKLVAADGTETTILFNLKKEDGKWKIVNFVLNPSQETLNSTKLTN